MLVVAVFCLGLFMTLLDITIVNIAIPDLVTDLGASLETVLWVGSAYSLVYAVLLITAGRLGDIVGPKRMFLIGLSIFSAASLASGLAATSAQLVAFRAVQGLGAALLAPQGLPLITSILPRERRGPAFAAIGIMSGLGVLLGPTLGGLLVTEFGWRSIFLLNVPVGALTLGLTIATMPDVRPGRPHRLDLSGVGLLTGGLLAVVFGLIEGERYDWGTVAGFVSIPLLIGAGAALLLLFVIRQVRTQAAEPLLPLAVFADRTFTAMTLVLFFVGFAIVGLFLPLTIFYQSVLGLSAVAAGLVIGTQSVAMMITSGVVGGVSNSPRVNLKLVLLVGLLLFAAGMAWMVVNARPDSSQWSFVPALVVAGVGLGAVWTPVFGLATRDLPPSRAGVAAGVLDTVQEFGSVLATAVLGAVLANHLADGLREQAVRASATLPTSARVPLVEQLTAGAAGGLQVGAGQAGGEVPAGVPAELAAQWRAAAEQAFAGGFVDAMRPAMAIPVVAVLLAVVAVVFVRSRPMGASEGEGVGAGLGETGVAGDRVGVGQGEGGDFAGERAGAGVADPPDWLRSGQPPHE